MALPTTSLLFRVVDTEFDLTYSALDQRGVQEPVQTVDGLGRSQLAAVIDLNRHLLEQGLEPYSTEGLSDGSAVGGDVRWQYAATHILPN